MSSRRSDSESEETLFLPKAEEEINTEGYGIRNKRWTLCERALSLHNLLCVGIIINLGWTVANLRYMASFRCSEAPTIYGDVYPTTSLIALRAADLLPKSLLTSHWNTRLKHGTFQSG
jgi:hypothetical protein